MAFVLVLYACRDSNFNNPFKNQYKVSGTFFEGSNLKPVAFADIILFSENLSSGSGKPKEIAYTTTDVNGYFEFSYNQKKNLSDLFIQKDPTGNPVSFLAKTLLNGIAPNQNVTRNIFYHPFSLVRLSVSGSEQYYNDTLFVAGFQLENSRATPATYQLNVQNSGLPGFSFPLPLQSNQIGPFEVYWQPDLQSQFMFPIYFGVGKKQLLQALNGDTLLQKKVLVMPYPQVSEVRITL